MGKYILKKCFFAKKSFINEFSKDNVMGVFLPYMLIDTKELLNKEKTQHNFDEDVFIELKEAN